MSCSICWSVRPQQQLAKHESSGRNNASPNYQLYINSASTDLCKSGGARQLATCQGVHYYHREITVRCCCCCCCQEALGRAVFCKKRNGFAPETWVHHLEHEVTGEERLKKEIMSEMQQEQVAILIGQVRGSSSLNYITGHVRCGNNQVKHGSWSTLVKELLGFCTVVQTLLPCSGGSVIAEYRRLSCICRGLPFTNPPDSWC